jgi:hypothetical protein
MPTQLNEFDGHDESHDNAVLRIINPSCDLSYGNDQVHHSNAIVAKAV